MSKIDEQIRQAMEEGHFDNLPGKGKPLNLEDQTFENPEWRMANHLLRSNGFSLPWIEARREIEALLKAAVYALKRSWDWRNGSSKKGMNVRAIEDEWQRALGGFRQQIQQINKKIFDYNLMTPADRFQMKAVDAEQEVQRITGQ